MKKTLCLVLGAMLWLALPGKSAEAQEQTKPVDLTVRTLDRATLTNARVYFGAAGVDYFVDSANLSTNYTGTAVWIDSLPSTELTISDGYHITGDVDTSYLTSFVLAKDANNRYYVLGAGSNYELGVFQATTQLLGTSLNNAGYPMTVSHMLLTNNAVIEDNVVSQTSPLESQGWFYSTIASAMFWANTAEGISALTLVDNLTLNSSSSININNSLTINQNNKTITNQMTVPAFAINNSDVTWEGLVGTISSADGTDCIFKLDNASLMIRNVTATAGTSVAILENNSYLSTDVCNFTTSSDTASIIVVNDACRAEIGVNALNGPTGANAVMMASGSTGTLDILKATVEGTSLPIFAYGRVERSNGHNLYSRDLNIAADSANGDTVYLNMDYTGITPQTVASPAVLQLGTSHLSTLYVGHTSGTVEVLGGNVDIISGVSGNGPIELSVDSLGSLFVSHHPTTIVDGRYVEITTSSSGNDPISIEGGKFATRYDDFVAPRHFFVPNTDADSTQFPWTIGTGYRVTWVDWDYTNHIDTTIVYNTPDNKISPVLSVPTRYLSTDTTFIAWWTDSLFSECPWDFDNDVLTDDDTLYAEWHVVMPGVETYYTVRHVRVGIDALDSIVDTVRRYATIGSTVTTVPLLFPYYHSNDSQVSFVMPDHDTTLTFHYVRDTFQLTWNLTEGHFADNSPLVESLAWGQPIDYSRTPVRRGHTFAGWQNNVTEMPQHDITISAIWERNTYTVVWNIPSPTVTYAAAPVTGIYATYTHEEGTDTATLTYTDNATGLITDRAIFAGEYTINATALSTDFFLDPTTSATLLTIQKAQVSIDSFSVKTEKFYDGNDTAVITRMAEIAGVLGNDEIILDDVHAHFNDATVGEGKSIIVYYGIAGADIRNYALDTNTYLATINGAILAQYVYEDTANNGIAVNAMGYCAGSDTIRYFLQSGNPDEYDLIFSEEAVAQGFTNLGWQPLNASTPGIILIDIPADAANGLYTAKLVFHNSAHPNLVSDTATIGFSVNLPKTYTMPLFSDVIALVDTCHCFTDIYWFHSTDGGATWDSVAYGVYYYQEVGGLTGQYRVSAKMNGVPVISCAQDDVATLIADETAPAKVSVYPNPAVNRASITVSNSRNDIHTLRVMSIMGVEMENTTFSGDNCQLDLSNYATGSYTVSVDGIVVRVIKK